MRCGNDQLGILISTVLKFGKTWSLYGLWEHWNWASYFWISTCLHFHCIKMLDISVPSTEIFSKGVPFLSDWIDHSVLEGSMCWRPLGNTGAGAGGSNCWGSFSSCWGKGGALSTFVVWPFMLFMGMHFFLMLFFCKCTDLEECSNLSFHSLYICSSPLFPVQYC